MAASAPNVVAISDWNTVVSICLKTTCRTSGERSMVTKSLNTRTNVGAGSNNLRGSIDPSIILPLKLFVRGDEYKFWGLWQTDVHLFGTADPEARVFILGTDKLGRDLFTRILYGGRISLSIGLVGVLISFVLGLLIGGASGYFGGTVDEISQRVIDLLRSIPTIPLWMSLSAALPRDWSIDHCAHR